MKITVKELKSLVREAATRDTCAVILYDAYGEEEIFIVPASVAEDFANDRVGDEVALTSLNVDQGEEDTDEATAMKFEDMANFISRSGASTVWDTESEEGGPVPIDSYVSDLRETASNLRSS